MLNFSIAGVTLDIHLLRFETSSSEYSGLCLTEWPFAFLHPQEELASRLEGMEWTCSDGLGRKVSVHEELICVQSTGCRKKGNGNFDVLYFCFAPPQKVKLVPINWFSNTLLQFGRDALGVCELFKMPLNADPAVDTLVYLSKLLLVCKV